MKIKEAFKEDIEQLNYINETINELIILSENVTDEDAKEHLINRVEELKRKLEQLKVRILATEMYIVKNTKNNPYVTKNNVKLPEKMKKKYGDVKTYAAVRLDQLEQEVKKRTEQTDTKIDFKTIYKCRLDQLKSQYPDSKQLKPRMLKRGIEKLELTNNKINETEENIKSEDKELEK